MNSKEEMMPTRPLKILVADEGITKTYLILEKICPICKGTGLQHNRPCDYCAEGWTTTEVGETILQLVLKHLITIIQNRAQ
jgi:hypothetical protein